MDLQAIRMTVSHLAREAGAALMKNFDQPHQQTVKRYVTDIVTEGDMASEAVILAGLREQFPDHHIVSEEGGGAGNGSAPAETAEYFWYIDPLDGTSNYASNIPLFSVSIGLADRHMRPLVGVVYDPFSDELYSAALGHGTTLNDRPITTSGTLDLQQAMLCSGFPYDSTKQDNNIREWAAFTRRTRGLRRFGSVALEMSYIAAGRLDGLWEQWLNSWDVMAGILLVREAGGAVSDFAGADSKMIYEGRQIVVNNSHLHAAMISLLSEVRSANP
jgi:myo-inositol-1(or 4)-monophosphatase